MAIIYVPRAGGSTLILRTGPAAQSSENLLMDSLQKLRKLYFPLTQRQWKGKQGIRD